MKICPHLKIPPHHSLPPRYMVYFSSSFALYFHVIYIQRERLYILETFPCKYNKIKGLSYEKYLGNKIQGRVWRRGQEIFVQQACRGRIGLLRCWELIWWEELAGLFQKQTWPTAQFFHLSSQILRLSGWLYFWQ